MQGWFDTPKTINVTHHMTKRRNEKGIGTLIDAGKAFDKIQHPVMIKTPSEIGIEGTYLNIIEARYDKPEANIILNDKS